MTWTCSSWRKFSIRQIPILEDDLLFEIGNTLRFKDPLVSLTDVLKLEKLITNLEETNSFILQMGECAEQFSQSNYNDVSSRA